MRERVKWGDRGLGSKKRIPDPEILEFPGVRGGHAN